MKITELLWWRTTRIKTISVSTIFFILLTIPVCLCSCQINGFPGINPARSYKETFTIEDQDGLDRDNLSGQKENPEDKNIFTFDFTKIKLNTTRVLDMDIRNCNLYMDMYSNIIILGEVLNSSGKSKTDVEITLDFIDNEDQIIDTRNIEAYVNYIQPGKKLPFYFIYSDKNKYLEISEIKIGVNYNNYNKDFKGLPVVSRESHFYKDDMLVIEGGIENIGNSDVEDLKLFVTFYDLIDRVVFIREGFLEKEELPVFDRQEFKIRILIDEYIKAFTHYGLEVFFRDSFKVNEI